MRNRYAVFNGGRLFGYPFVYGIFGGEYRFNDAACQAKLLGVRFGVYSNVLVDVTVFFFSFLERVALYYVFRLASACQRVAVEDKNQPLGGVRNQGAVVCYHHVFNVDVRV